jgi:hypothetical protein
MNAMEFVQEGTKPTRQGRRRSGPEVTAGIVTSEGMTTESAGPVRRRRKMVELAIQYRKRQHRLEFAPLPQS